MNVLLQDQPPLHLTYCLNIHPGETWAENLEAIRRHTLQVRDRVAAGGKSFGLGLRLSATAADELRHPDRLSAFRAFLEQEHLYVFTINGFPYGRFHATAVKEQVYRPDWQDVRRRDYTLALADILAALLPEGVPGSISTVPCSYKAWVQSPRQVAAMAGLLADVAAYLAQIRRRTGRDICLALEPEPDCWLETTQESIGFFHGPLLEYGLAHLRERGWTATEAEGCLRRHVGICVDTAHAAVAFEDLASSLRQLRQADIRIGKVQLSAALQLNATEAALARLGSFGDTVYLHQVKARQGDGPLQSYPDLPQALADPQGRTSPERSLRVHFHVPLYCDRIEPLASTSLLMTSEFWALLRSGLTAHAEIETYTFDVLPKDLQAANVAESIRREYEWVMRRCGPGQCCPEGPTG